MKDTGSLILPGGDLLGSPKTVPSQYSSYYGDVLLLIISGDSALVTSAASND